MNPISRDASFLCSRLLFNNPDVLRCYLSGKLPPVSDIVDGLFIEEWRRRSMLPDHYLKNRRDFVLSRGAMHGKSSISLSEVILKVLDDIGDRCFEWRGGRIFVHEDAFAAWQELLPLVSPLTILARQIQRKMDWPSNEKLRLDFVREWVETNFIATALPHPLNPLVEGLIRRTGLIESHCHLNGSTEADVVWIDAVSDPYSFYKEVKKGWSIANWSGTAVREFYQQIESGLTPVQIWVRLRSARSLRRLISEHIFGSSRLTSGRVREFTDISNSTMVKHWKSTEHPAQEFLSAQIYSTGLIREACFLIAIFSALENYHDESVAHAFYYTQLVGTLIMRLSVQQNDQFGFEQFQKITVDGSRAILEEEYSRRFHQFHGVGGDLSLIEGRFSPCDNGPDTLKRLRKIDKGFNNYLEKHKPDFVSQDLSLRPAARHDQFARGTTTMELGTVCHFIKRPDLDSYGCRHNALRSLLPKQGRGLVGVLDMEKRALHYRFSGVDAASNEMHTPPEVFAPLFRFLRRHGLVNFTYHAGEDFVHLLSGIRAVHEAVVFLSLRSGNRIGHGVSVGIDPDLWLSRVGSKLVVSQGDHLDDLVFAYSRLMRDRDYVNVALGLEKKIEELSFKIYKMPVSPLTLYNSWLLRSVDPLLAFNKRRLNNILDPLAYEEESDLVEQFDSSDVSGDIFRSYHGRAFESLGAMMNKWNTLIEVNSDVVPAEAIWRLQEMQLEELVENNIAIESLPTSNVRIGFYQAYEEHHLFRWLGLCSKKGAQPIVCLGSDDPGIFATSMRSEFYHIFRVLTSKFFMVPERAVEVLSRLNRNAEAFRFMPEDKVFV